MRATHRIGHRPERVRNSLSSISQARLSLKEAEEPSEHLIGYLLVHIMPGGQRFAADVVGAQLPQAERVGKPLADTAGGTPQHQDRHFEFAAEVGGVEFAVDPGGGAIVAARAADRLFVKAANVLAPDF